MTAVVPEPGWGVAFAAGVVSFLSPCVAPLAPGYLAYVAGASVDGGEVALGRRNARLLGTCLLFMLGFTFVFVALGTSVSFLSSFLDEHRQLLYQVAGGAMVFLGLLISGLVRIPWLYVERRLEVSAEALGPAAPVLLGMTMAFAWTPCVGPILGAILFYAGATETAGRGGLLLLVYSLGFAVPFILAGMGFATALRVVAWARRRAAIINALSGAVIMGLGAVMLMGKWPYVSLWMQKLYYTLLS